VNLLPPGRAREVDVAKVRRWLRERREAFVADLATYVSLETPSTSKACLARALDWITGYLTDALGPPERLAVTDGGAHGDVLVADFAGAGPHRLMMLCHYDTVWEEGTLAGWPFAVRDGVATGPGVFDMKTGLVQAVWAVRALDAAGIARPPLRFVLNGDEELGSPASRATVEAAAEGVVAALVMEPGVDGAVKTARKGVGIFRIETRGVEAHTGLDPDKGVSAIDEMAATVLELRALHDLDRGTSVNVGTVRGGTRSNVVAGHAEASLDVRVTDMVEAARVEEALTTIAPHIGGARVTITGGWNRPPMPRTPGNAAMYELARIVAAGLGEELGECAAGGGSDGNFLAAAGLPVLDGLGAVGAGAHSRGEHVLVDPSVARAALVAGLMHCFALEEASAG